jgi:hypothetical protein
MRNTAVIFIIHDAASVHESSDRVECLGVGEGGIRARYSEVRRFGLSVAGRSGGGGDGKLTIHPAG